jgi:hypothetical protein
MEDLSERGDPEDVSSTRKMEWGLRKSTPKMDSMKDRFLEESTVNEYGYSDSEVLCVISEHALS